MLTREIADQIVQQTMMRLNRNINIMDREGTIIASGDPARINLSHEGALEVLRTGKQLVITEENRHQWKGALPGINLPIQFQGEIIGVIGITGDPSEIDEFGQLVKMITEMMIQQSFFTSQQEWKQRIKELLFEQLVHGSPSAEELHQRAEMLHVQLLSPYQVALIEMADPSLPHQELIQKIEEVLADGQMIVGHVRVNRLFVLTAGVAEQVLRKKLERLHKILFQTTGIQVRIGMGTPVDNWQHIRFSLEEADWALLLGDMQADVTTYSQVETKAFIDRLNSRAKQQYAERRLSNLSERLIETLDVFFSCNLHIGEAASRLYIHRNTLLYRLKKIAELTGLDPQQFHDAVSLQLAIWMYQMEKNKQAR